MTATTTPALAELKARYPMSVKMGGNFHGCSYTGEIVVRVAEEAYALGLADHSAAVIAAREDERAKTIRECAKVADDWHTAGAARSAILALLRDTAKAEQGDANGTHLINGEFQSDKYPTCPRGKVPLSVKDATAQDLLWEYAQRRRTVDSQFSDDMETALKIAGFTPSQPAERAVDWRPISEAPREKMVLVYGNSGVMLGYQDALGNWRQRHHGPHRTKPTHWMPLPPAPRTEGE